MWKLICNSYEPRKAFKTRHGDAKMNLMWKVYTIFTECLFFILQVLNGIFVHSKSLNLRSLTHMTGGYMSVSILVMNVKTNIPVHGYIEKPLRFYHKLGLLSCSHVNQVKQNCNSCEPREAYKIEAWSYKAKTQVWKVYKWFFRMFFLHVFKCTICAFKAKAP